MNFKKPSIQSTKKKRESRKEKDPHLSQIDACMDEPVINEKYKGMTVREAFNKLVNSKKDTD